MKNRTIVFVMGILCAAPMLSYGDSLLHATQFPKTINDLSFQDKYAILAEGYGGVDTVYDADGRCISGCAYVGLNITEDKQNTQEATEYFSNLINDIDDDDTGDDTVDIDNPDEQTSSTIKEKIANLLNKNKDTTKENSATLAAKKRLSGSDIPLRAPLQRDLLITGDFGWRNTTVQGRAAVYLHNGIDLHAVVGTPVYATANGIVEEAATGNNGGNGVYIRIRHKNGLYTEYKHLSELYVNKNDSVSAGQKIADSGNTGFSQGPHLHYDIYWLKNGNTKAYIDVLCPCVSSASTKNYNQSLQSTQTNWSCKSSALHKPYKFSGNNKKVQWRIASGHCMTTPSDKLPDEE
jgi:murein DD-endopeptidase MepM/ murein hydrolase activator NlpD